MNNKGKTPLLIAVKKGQQAAVKLLLENKANTEIADELGNTPLISHTGHPEITKLLLSAGANPNHQNNYGKSALHYTAEKGQIATMKILLKAKAINKIPQDTHGDTPLHWAVSKGQQAAVKLLLENKANTEIADELGNTPLISHTGNAEITKLLLSAGANPNHQNKDGRSALHYTAEKGQTATMNVLLKARNINKEVKDKWGLTPLKIAVNNKQSEAAKLLTT